MNFLVHEGLSIVTQRAGSSRNGRILQTSLPSAKLFFIHTVIRLGEIVNYHYEITFVIFICKWWKKK